MPVPRFQTMNVDLKYTFAFNQWYEDLFIVSLSIEDDTGRIQKVVTGSDYELPTKNPFSETPGYVFTGWSYTPNGPLITEKTITITSHTTLYGVCQVALTYDPNGSSSDPVEETAAKTDSFTVPADAKGLVAPSHTEFDGWSLTSDGEKIETPISLLAPTTLYARWKKTHYQVTYSAGEGTGTKEDDWVSMVDGQYTFPDSTGLSKDPGKFDYWKTSLSDTDEYHPGDVITIDQDITVTAYWKMGDVLCKFDANGASGEMAPVLVWSTFTAPEPEFEKYDKHEFNWWTLMIDGAAKGSYYPGASITVPAGTTEITLVAQWKFTIYLRAAKDLSECQPGSTIYIFAAYSTGSNVRPLRATTDGSYKAYSGAPYFDGNRTPYKLKITSESYANRYSTIKLSNGNLQIVNLDSDTPEGLSGIASTSSTPNDLITREGGSNVGQGRGTSLIQYHSSNFGYVCVADLQFSSGAGTPLSARYYAGSRQFFVFVEDEEA